MAYDLCFVEGFFFEEHDDHFGGETNRPTSVYSAIKSMAALRPRDWQSMLEDVFPNVPPARVDVDMVMAKIRETNTCRNITNPVEVYIDREGWHSVTVYEKR